MKGFNLIIVYNGDFNKILFCKRAKEPYKGLFNLVGGKIEEHESGIDSAYRELYEETNIDKACIKLTYLMALSYPLLGHYIEVYVGRLNRDVELIKEVNELYWLDPNENFFNVKKFAGEGNIGHMIMQVNILKNSIEW